MRNLAILMTVTALATLSACSGGDAQSASSVSVAPVTGTGTGSGGTSNTDVYAQFLNPTVPRTFSGIGGSLVMDYNTDSRTNSATGVSPFPGDDSQQGFSFGGYSSTVRNSGITLSYDPRDAVFTLTVSGTQNNNNTGTRFQDPASRTDFLGSRQPQWGVDNLAAYPGIGANDKYSYLQSGDGDPRSLYLASGSGFVVYGDNNTPSRVGNPSLTAGYQASNLFYEKPEASGTGTRYVTLAGFIRNTFSWSPATLSTGVTIAQTVWHLERGAFAYGIQTDPGLVPKSGTGTYTGTMLGTMIFNPTLDTAQPLPNFFQWISGTSATTINFASGAVTLALNGVAGRGGYDYQTTPQAVTIAQGTAFTAAGTATIDLVRTGGFTGQFQSAQFGATTNGLSPVINIAGSTIDGAFFGPAAEEVGGGFRIVGGNPDQRIDIVGAFKGRKP